MKKAIVYVDGFNLYYGIDDRKLNHAKWLDLQKFYTSIFPEYNIVKIKYFTSLIQDPQKRIRQRVYWKALQTLKNLEITQGEFQTKTMKCMSTLSKKLVEVIKCTEKQTDVNLACTMILDANFISEIDAFILSSVDSDYTFPVNHIYKDLKKEVHVVSTQKYSNFALKAKCTSFRTVKNQTLESSRFSNKIPSGNGFICCPKEWM